jgi:hypothetical protein
MTKFRDLTEEELELMVNDQLVAGETHGVRTPFKVRNSTTLMKNEMGEAAARIGLSKVNSMIDEIDAYTRAAVRAINKSRSIQEDDEFTNNATVENDQEIHDMDELSTSRDNREVAKTGRLTQNALATGARMERATEARKVRSDNAWDAITNLKGRRLMM